MGFTYNRKRAIAGVWFVFAAMFAMMFGFHFYWSAQSLKLNPFGETADHGQLGCVIALGRCAAARGWLDANSTGDR